MKKSILYIFCFTLVMIGILPAKTFANGKSSYIILKNNSALLGNENIELQIGTAENNSGLLNILNKRSGENYFVSSGEFLLTINFAGFGPAYGKKQNGENLSRLSKNDFEFLGYSVNESNDNTKKIKLMYHFESYYTSVFVNVNYFVSSNDFYVRKNLEIWDESQGIQWLEKAAVQNLTFKTSSYTKGSFGQPVFYKTLFLGLEYPAFQNKINGKNLKCEYIVGRKITKDTIRTHNAVIGVSSSESKLAQTFLEYIDQIKVNGTRPFLLYNSWYDFRNPAIVKEDESVMNIPNILKRIDTFKKYMVDKYGITLDAFVLDDGWDNYESVWGIDSTRFPNGFTPLLEPLKKINSSLGIWASPFCGYSNRKKRVEWAASHGYEKVGEFLCFAGKNYKKEFKRKMTEYTHDYNMGYFKWDGFLLACNEANHGHLPGIYSREALIHTYIDMMKSVRNINPDIFINITVGSWLSPWWLQYADCIWMQGEDYAYAEEVPSLFPRDKSITYRDAVLWDDLQNQQLLFPMSSLMTHGIIKGRLNLLGGKNESLLSFANEVTMYFGRGVMMWELYISPDMLNDNEWDVLASSVKWAKANVDVLKKTKMILGNPLKRQVYGYAHLTPHKGIIILRNPDVYPKSVEIALADSLGELAKDAEYFVQTVYPFNFIDKRKVKRNDILKVKLDSYEIKVLELKKEIPSDLPVGSRFGIDKNNVLTVYEEKDNIPINISMNSKIVKNKENIEVKFNNTVDLEKGKIAFLIEPEFSNEDRYQFNMKINGKKVTPLIETENNKWFWVSAGINQTTKNIKLNYKFMNGKKPEVSAWLIGESGLEKIRTVKLDEDLKFDLPAKPYPSGVKRIFLNIVNNEN